MTNRWGVSRSGFTKRPRCSCALAPRVDQRIYLAMGHLVNTDEIAAVNAILAQQIS